jgi:hypothetical protein
MLGKAMDTTMPGMSMSQIREIGMRMQRGGVGYYPHAGTPFVHLDVGSVRSWPRMTYDQLARLFPDGKTVHLPANNQPLARYEEAKAEIEARGGSYAPVEQPASKGKSFLAFLFGGEDDEDAVVAAPPPAQRKQWASLAPRRTARGADVEEEGATLAEKPGRRGRSEKITAAERNLPRGETQLRQGPAEPAATPAPAPVAVASLEPIAVGESEEAVLVPLPPRRPSRLGLVDAPLPPARPFGLVASSDDFSIPLRAGAGNAIASLIDQAIATPAVPETRPAKPEPLLAYAPAAAAASPPPRGAAVEPPTGLRLSNVAKSAAESPATPRIALVPARLDRSNFQALTSARPARLVFSSGTTLGSMIGAPRSAARAEAGLYTASAVGAPTTVFSGEADILPSDRFVAR